MTQEALATKLQLAGLDLDRIAVAKIEARIRSVFDYELAVIADLLSVPVDALLPSHGTLKPLLSALQRGTTEQKPKSIGIHRDGRASG